MKTLTLLLLAFALTAAAICPRIRQQAAVPVPWQPAPTTVFIDPAARLHRLHAASAAHLQEVYVQAGSRVVRGQLLAKVSVPFHSVQHQKLQAALNRTQQEYAALLKTPASEAAAVAEARQRLDEAAQWLAASPPTLVFEFIQAPASGLVVALPLSQGAYLSDTTAVVVLAETLPASGAVATSN